jgi:hypothetical protein
MQEKISTCKTRFSKLNKVVAPTIENRKISLICADIRKAAAR